MDNVSTMYLALYCAKLPHPSPKLKPLRFNAMSASKLFLFGTSLFRSTAASRKTPFPPLLSYKPFPFKPLHFHCYCSSATAIDATTDNTTEALTYIHNQKHEHPWPEWVTFVDRLKARGYFTQAIAKDESGATSDATVSTESLYNDLNQLKDPCLRFARDRYDIFKSLSIPDIQAVVEGGCPNLLRKAVNSAKRLRAFARLDEGDVCSACNLRGSCDRAYVILKDNEADARTVDIVRILLFYALDLLVVSGGEKNPGRELVELSARKLLAELIELSEKLPDQALPKPTVNAVNQKKQDAISSNNKLFQDVKMKRGDWMCPKCSFLNFSRNVQCLKCGEEGAKRVVDNDIEMKKGDWICPDCNFMNFARNIKCLRCKEQGPLRIETNDVQRKKGDWDCMQCRFMNFASNKVCFRCRQQREPIKNGDWVCPSCNFFNYKWNAACLKCKCDRPKEAAT